MFFLFVSSQAEKDDEKILFRAQNSAPSGTQAYRSETHVLHFIVAELMTWRQGLYKVFTTVQGLYMPTS